MDRVGKIVIKDNSKDKWINSHLTWVEKKREELIKEWIKG